MADHGGGAYSQVASGLSALAAVTSQPLTSQPLTRGPSPDTAALVLVSQLRTNELVGGAPTVQFRGTQFVGFPVRTSSGLSRALDSDRLRLLRGLSRSVGRQTACTESELIAPPDDRCAPKEHDFLVSVNPGSRILAGGSPLNLQLLRPDNSQNASLKSASPSNDDDRPLKKRPFFSLERQWSFLEFG